MATRSIKSAERTLALFELFSRRQLPLTVAEVTRGLNIPQPSASMLLSNLMDLGYLEYDRFSRTYAPSIRVVLLGSWIGRRFSDAGALSSKLDELHRLLGGTVYVGIQNGAAAQYVLVQESGEPDRLNVDSGQMRSLTLSAMGRSLLSVKPDAEILRWVRRCNAEAKSDRFRVQESEFMTVIAQVRENGFAETLGTSAPGLGAIAVHVPSPLGHTSLAIGWGGAVALVQARREEGIRALQAFQASVAKHDGPDQAPAAPLLARAGGAGRAAVSRRRDLAPG
jgi:IclR family KDG regulon transcriptional repressor